MNAEPHGTLTGGSSKRLCVMESGMADRLRGGKNHADL